ncbi:MAG: Maf family protein [Actinomycetota bacterium]
MIRIILASQSPARLRTLRRAGIEPLVHVSGVDEEAVTREAGIRYGSLTPDQVALLLARAKAERVAALDPLDILRGNGIESGQAHADQSCGERFVVVGCDSVLEFAGQAYGRPVDRDEAESRWRAMRGASGVLHTGHWVVDGGVSELTASEAIAASVPRSMGASSSTTVHFADITDEELAAYVATGEPLEVAGAFTTDGLGGAFIRGIEGDHHTVVGLSLPVLRTLLADCGIPWTALWNHQSAHST